MFKEKTEQNGKEENKNENKKRIVIIVIAIILIIVLLLTLLFTCGNASRRGNDPLPIPVTSDTEPAHIHDTTCAVTEVFPTTSFDTHFVTEATPSESYTDLITDPSETDPSETDMDTSVQTETDSVTEATPSESETERETENETETEILTDPVTEHTHKFTSTVIKEPTCINRGKMLYKCECGESYTEDISPLGHKYGSWTVTKDSTCTETGTKVRTCQRESCGYQETATISKKDHNWSDWTVIKEASTTEKGLKERRCQNCGKTEQREIDKIKTDELLFWNACCEESRGKVFFTAEQQVRTILREPTADRCGYSEYTCPYCGKVFGKYIPRTSSPNQGMFFTCQREKNQKAFHGLYPKNFTKTCYWIDKFDSNWNWIGEEFVIANPYPDSDLKSRVVDQQGNVIGSMGAPHKKGTPEAEINANRIENVLFFDDYWYDTSDWSALYEIIDANMDAKDHCSITFRYLPDGKTYSYEFTAPPDESIPYGYELHITLQGFEVYVLVPHSDG